MFGKNKNLIISIGIFSLVLVAGSVILNVNAQTQTQPQTQPLIDSDIDGLTDDAEINTYHTNPNSWDTDGDKFSDSQEVLAGTNPLDANSNPLTTIKTKSTEVPLIDQHDPIAWYAGRTAGIVSFVLFTYVVAFGLFQSSKAYLKWKFLSAPLAMEIHRLIAWTGLFTVTLHVASFFFDTYIRLNLKELLVPFILQRPFQTALGFDFAIPTGLGIVGFYIILVLITTSELRRKIVSIKIWRIIHYISFLGYVMFLVHGIMTGTDTMQPWMIGIYVVSVIIVFFFLLLRITAKWIFYPPRVESKSKLLEAQPIQTLIPETSEYGK